MKADDYLSENGYDFEILEHDEKPETCEEAAEIRGLRTEQVVKSLIIERQGEYLHCLVPGDRELSGSKLGEYRMTDPEKSRELTGQASGTVHPFSTELKHLVDHRLFENEELSFTTGEFTRAVKIESGEFRKALEQSGFETETGDFVEVDESELEELEELGIPGEDARFLLSNGLRHLFLSLQEEHEPGETVTALRKLLREDVEPEEDEVSGLIERAESETHMQKLATQLAEEGELDEEEGFELEKVVEQVLEQNPEAVEDYRDGRDSAVNYLMGQVMEQTNGRADPGDTKNRILEEIG